MTVIPSYSKRRWLRPSGEKSVASATVSDNNVTRIRSGCHMAGIWHRQIALCVKNFFERKLKNLPDSRYNPGRF